MGIAWSRISSKVIVQPPYTNAACSRRRGNGKAVWAHVYRIWLTKESRKSWERVWTEHGAQSVHGVQRRERRIRWRLGLPWPPAGCVSGSVALRQRLQQRVSRLEV